MGAARGKERDGPAEFGSNLSRRLQSDGAARGQLLDMQ